MTSLAIERDMKGEFAASRLNTASGEKLALL